MLPYSFIKRLIFHTFEPTATDLAIVRIVFCLILFYKGLGDYAWLAHEHDIFYNPPPRVPRWIDMCYDEDFWKFLNFLNYVFLVFILIGFLTPISSALFFVVSVFVYSKVFSFGKIDHGFFVCLTPLLLGIAGWGNKWSLDAILFENLKIKKWALSYLALCLGLAFLTAALPKILGGWLLPDQLMSKGFIIKKIYYEGVQSFFANALLAADINAFFKLLDYFTVAFELLFVFLIFHRYYGKWILLATCFFHVGVQAFMGIDFSGHMTAYLPFIALFLDTDSFWHYLTTKKWLWLLLVFALLLFVMKEMVLFITFFCLIACCIMPILKKNNYHENASKI